MWLQSCAFQSLADLKGRYFLDNPVPPPSYLYQEEWTCPQVFPQNGSRLDPKEQSLNIWDNLDKGIQNYSW